MKVIEKILSRLDRLENKTQVEFVAEFDTGRAIAKDAAESVKMFDPSGIPGIAYFARGTAPKCDYIILSYGDKVKYMKTVDDVEVDRDGNEIAFPKPVIDAHLRLGRTLVPEPKKKLRKRRSIMSGTNKTVMDSFLALPVGGSREIASREWKGRTKDLGNALWYHGKKYGAKFALRTRGNHYLVTRKS